ncbi:MAG: HNH endonuclease [Proteobacteria bacterium]|nr:HNH endonuclease [Pseudomonadota bacterium]
MKLWVGVTDKNWFDFLMRLAPDEVNFWQPSGSRNFKVLQPGEPFLFKLHAPNNFIVGGGFFVRYSALPASLAWDAFEEKNGVTSLSDLRTRVQRYRPKDNALDPIIGCNVLVEPFFFERKDWIPVPESFALNIVSGKSYDTATEAGRSLWESVRRAMSFTEGVRELSQDESQPTDQRFGEAYLTRGRLGQGAFRVLVTDAYQRRCAVTGEKTLPVLEAAHIKPYSEHGPHRVSNGILLRSDLHKLFDLGYVTVTPDLCLEVSPRLREEWHNGREYYAHHGKELRFRPDNPLSMPSRDFLVWHNENRFKS